MSRLERRPPDGLKVRIGGTRAIREGAQVLKDCPPRSLGMTYVVTEESLALLAQPQAPLDPLLSEVVAPRQVQPVATLPSLDLGITRPLAKYSTHQTRCDRCRSIYAEQAGTLDRCAQGVQTCVTTVRELCTVKYVAYLRVSTARQGQSGLGLEAQRAAVASLVTLRGGVLLETFVEVESGGLDQRPELESALYLARVTGATLAIAKLDRLSRNASFLLTLQDSDVRFIAADMPDANELTVGIMALVAQQERIATSHRTKEALLAAKRRGCQLGNPNGAEALRRAGRGNADAVRALKAAADNASEKLRPLVKALQAAGIVSLGGIAAEFNSREVLSPRGGNWHRSSVSNLLKRLELHSSSSTLPSS